MFRGFSEEEISGENLEAYLLIKSLGSMGKGALALEEKRKLIPRILKEFVEEGASKQLNLAQVEIELTQANYEMYLERYPSPTQQEEGEGEGEGGKRRKSISIGKRRRL